MSRRYFALSAITSRIEEYLRPALGRLFWVKAEISSGRERNGAFFCDLLETDAQGRVVAQMPCRIWSTELRRIRNTFEASGLDLELADGTVVGMACELQYNARHGLSLKGVEMDPAIALGELELRRRRILEALERDGLLELNARCDLGLLPNRIGLITSRDSAACRDVIGTLRASAYGFRIYLADALVQGADAERSVLAALDACARLPIDLVLIARGGGSKTDLAHLDSEAIGRRIAHYPLQVWTGIGHETDRGVLDCVAACAFKTPTAAAEELLRRFADVDQRTAKAARSLRSIWSLRRDAAVEHLRRAGIGLRQGSRKLLETRQLSLRAAAQTVRARVSARLSGQRARQGERRAEFRGLALGRLREERARWTAIREGFRAQRVVARLEAERRSLGHRLQALRAADPRTALARGFSLTYTPDGALVRTIEQLEPHQTILTRLADGHVESTVDKTVEGDDG